MKLLLLLIIAGAFLSVPRATAKEPELEIFVELREVAGIDEPGEVVRSEVRLISPGEDLVISYVDPTEGHNREIEFDLQAIDAGSPPAVKLAFRWYDRTENRLIKEAKSMIVQGTFSLSLYSVPGSKKMVVLRATPRSPEE